MTEHGGVGINNGNHNSEIHARTRSVYTRGRYLRHRQQQRQKEAVIVDLLRNVNRNTVLEDWHTGVEQLLVCPPSPVECQMW